MRGTLRLAPDREGERMRREFAKAARKINASIHEGNREIERGNKRRRFCVEKVCEWAMKDNPTQARVWLMKLVSAGFKASDGAAMELLDMTALEAECRRMLQ